MRISDEERREVARKLRSLDEYIEGMPSMCTKQEHNSMALGAIRAVVGKGDIFHLLADLIEPQHIDGNTSDGYHTFNELYHHRAVLFSVIVAKFADRAWKSKLHADGTMYEGMFIVGIETPDGQATYHYDVEPYWNLFRCKEVDRAPEWDGHTPDQAIDRIGKLVDCKTDRPTCRNVSGDQNRFECSECGFEMPIWDGDGGWMAFYFCPNCGAEVVE